MTESEDFEGGLRIVGSGGGVIDSLPEWLMLAPPAGGLKQWRDNHSAKELARAWTRGGRAGVPEEVAELLAGDRATSHMRLGLARPEMRLKLDDHPGNTRNADLVLHGTAGRKRTLVTIEAKANEAFGSSIDRTRESVVAKKASKLPARLRALSELVFGTEEGTGELAYQLVHGLAATLLEADRRTADQAAFVVHEFITANTDPKRQVRNALDLEAFVDRLGTHAPDSGGFVFITAAGMPKLPVYIGKIVTRVG